MKAELKTMSRKELEKLRKDVEAALEKVESREMKLAHDAAAKAAADYGFSLDEINNMPAAVKRGGKSAKTISAPKYRNPEDATQTWTGKGRQPEWYKTAMANGTDPQTLEI
ncbi:H-NS histone family protein [Loktanella sp. M215]|uniref:H-NS histone family protein n=1 Tax=Loktanella sp. M215 TaxID=2675431 RepID=UPI001F343AC5|nr:H-NS histone family protein [Loktanella sp. M215]